MSAEWKFALSAWVILMAGYWWLWTSDNPPVHHQHRHKEVKTQNYVSFWQQEAHLTFSGEYQLLVHCGGHNVGYESIYVDGRKVNWANGDTVFKGYLPGKHALAAWGSCQVHWE